MAPASTATPSSARRGPAKIAAVPPATGTRVTRLRAAKETGSAISSPVAPAPRQPKQAGGIFARSKEGLRKVSSKAKEKEKKEMDAKALKAPPTGDHQESLQVSRGQTTDAVLMHRHISVSGPLRLL